MRVCSWLWRERVFTQIKFGLEMSGLPQQREICRFLTWNIDILIKHYNVKINQSNKTKNTWLNHSP